MKRLGKRYAAVLLLGVVGVILALVGAAAAEVALALTGLALALLAALGAQVSNRLDLHRLQRESRDRGAPLSPAQVHNSHLDDRAVGYRLLAEDMERIAAENRADLRKQSEVALSATIAELAAVVQLIHGSTSPQVIRPDDPVTPSQIVDALGTLTSRSARRVLTIGLGVSNHWLAQDLAGESGHLTAVFEKGRTEQVSASSRLRSLLEIAGTSHVVRLSVAPGVIPSVEGAYLPWPDLTEAREAGPFDAVVLAAASEKERRAALPVLELLEPCVVSGGCVILLDKDPEHHLARAWEAADGWRAITDPACTTTFVPER